MKASDDKKLRQVRERSGRRGEWLAAFLLIVKGYRILGHRVRTPVGEIDLIARAPSGVVCFVEVKMRSLGNAALEALGPRQQIRIARAAELYLTRRPMLASRGIRFDVVTVTAGGLPRHMRGAWQMDCRVPWA